MATLSRSPPRRPYTGKPRPALVVQTDRLSQLASVMVCPLTAELIAAAPLRVRIEPGRLNNLRQSSDVMVDKLSAVPRDAVGEAFGRLSAAELSRVDVGLRLLLEI